MGSHSNDDTYLKVVVPKRIALFESIKAEQLSHLRSIAGGPIKITLEDGAIKEGRKWETSPLDVAKGISKSLAASGLIAQVDGVLWDMTRPLEGDCELKIFNFDHNEGRDTFWHSSAHILGQALDMEYGCKLSALGLARPGERASTMMHFMENWASTKITKSKLRLVQEKQPFERIEVTRDQALDMFSENPFKVEIIND
ncbi:hypothetical protein MLD38_005327 [Melastoma candidum]|uniref:Uncharacterized protein n=1 Tax=Melastoma candidum TaxID=119954 RepID=A0ACB9SCF0_9MYRT|nr:hypothetical protein MLD38_005327 [Melastoma candidum]